MTYELELYTEQTISVLDLRRALDNLKLILVADSGCRENHAFVVMKVGQNTPLFSLTRCEVQEPEQLPRFLDYSLADFRGLIQTSASGGQAANTANDLLELLARSQKGAIFDPQIGKIIYPRIISVVAGRSERLDVLRLYWQFPYHKAKDAVSVVLGLLEEVFVEALPLLYSTLPPVHLGRSYLAKQDFVSEFSKENRVYWTALSPVVFCSLLAAKDGGERIESQERLMALSIWLEKKALLISEDLREVIVNRFVSLAERLNCLYAAGYVERDCLLSNGNLSHGRSEAFSLGAPSHWNGIPDVRTWLTWFGESILPSVKPYLPNDCISKGGHFMRLRTLPASVSELTGDFPVFPMELLNRNSGNRVASSREEIMQMLGLTEKN